MCRFYRDKKKETVLIVSCQSGGEHPFFPSVFENDTEVQEVPDIGSLKDFPPLSSLSILSIWSCEEKGEYKKDDDYDTASWTSQPSQVSEAYGDGDLQTVWATPS